MDVTATLTADLALWFPGKINAPKAPAKARAGTTVRVINEGGTMSTVIVKGREFKAVTRYALAAIA